MGLASPFAKRDETEKKLYSSLCGVPFPPGMNLHFFRNFDFVKNSRKNAFEQFLNIFAKFPTVKSVSEFLELNE